MDYIYHSNYSGTGISVGLSRFTPPGGAPEAHAILSITPAVGALSMTAQMEAMAGAIHTLCGHMVADGLHPVMGRWLLSDAANTASRLPAIPGEAAVSIVEQPPLDSTKGALWLYFMPSRPSSGPYVFTSRADRPAYRHFFTASASIPGFGSHTATAALLSDYDTFLREVSASLADGCLRTWFFVRDVDYFYRGVVSGRNEVFEAKGLTPSTHFIASTGIGGAPERADVTVKMDAWAATGLAPGQVTYISAPDYLNPTYEYGVAFERATAIDYGDRRHLLVSGTASIDCHGNIVAPGDIEGQTARMLDNVEALLRSGGMAWSDVAHMIIYLRDPADYPLAASIISRRFPLHSSPPRVMVRGQVCRQGWLIEMECMAVAPASNPAYAPF